MTKTTSKTYQIAARNLPALTASLDKIAARAKRLGVQAVTYEVGAERPVPMVDANRGLTGIQSEWVAWREGVHGPLAPLERSGAVRYARFVDVTVGGVVPRLAGWAFVATLQHVHLDGGGAAVLLRAVPGEEVPEGYRSASPEQCDHCRRRIRTRRETFVLRHDDGRYAQVGRDCTQDFLGGEDPHAVAAALDAILAAHAAAAGFGDGEGGGHADGGWPIHRFLSVAAALVRQIGWASRSQARASEESGRPVQATADTVVYYLDPPPRGSKAASDWARFVDDHPVTEADEAFADAALEHARGLEGGSDYEHNLSVACRLPAVGRREAGIVASLVAAWLRAVGTPQGGGAPSAHVGTVGERGLFRVRLERIIVCESSYGTSYLHKMACSASGAAALDGGDRSDAVAWFASSNGEMEEGREYTVRATVKSHSEYRGEAQTSLARLAVLTEEDVAKERAKLARAAKRQKSA